MLEKTLYRIVSFFKRKPRPARLCHAGPHAIEGAAFLFKGHHYCSFYCFPAVYRARLAGVRP